MAWYTFLVDIYNQILGYFPAGLQWLITLLILIGFVGAFAALIRRSVLWVVLLVIVLPILFPVFARFFLDLYKFLLYLIQSLAGSAPRP